MNDPKIAQGGRFSQDYLDFMTDGEKLSYAWLAGIIDGEGTIDLKMVSKRKDACTGSCTLLLQVAMTHSASRRQE